MNARLKKIASLVAFVAFLPTQARGAQEHVRPGQDPSAGFQTFHNIGTEAITGIALFKDPLTQEVVASPYQVAFVGNKFVGFNALLSEGLHGEPVFARVVRRGIDRIAEWGKIVAGIRRRL